jgi:hypothetical protein
MVYGSEWRPAQYFYQATAASEGPIGPLYPAGDLGEDVEDRQAEGKIPECGHISSTSLTVRTRSSGSTFAIHRASITT